MAKIKMELEWDTVADAKARQEIEAAEYKLDCEAEADRDARIAAMTPEQREHDLRIRQIRAEARIEGSSEKSSFLNNFYEGMASVLQGLNRPHAGCFHGAAVQMPVPFPADEEKYPLFFFDAVAERLRNYSAELDIATKAKDWPSEKARASLGEFRQAMALFDQRIAEMFEAYNAEPAPRPMPTPTPPDDEKH